MRIPRAHQAALAALAALPWLYPFASGPSPQVQPWFVTATCAVALWLLAAAGDAPARPRLTRACVAMVAWAVLSHGSLRPEHVFLAGGLALVALTAGCSSQPGVPRAMQAGFLAASAVTAAIGLIQYFGASPAFAPWINATAAGSAYGNLRQTNQYATFCWIGVAVLLFGTLSLRRRWSLPLAVLLGIGCAASVSRTGGLELVVLGIFCAWWPGQARRDRLVLFAAAAAAYAAGAWLLPALLEAATGAASDRTLWTRFRGDGCSSRLVLWSNVLHLIGQRPVAGWGWGELDFAHYVTLFDGPRFCEIPDNAHNLPLHLAVELGVPAAMLVCAGALAWAWRQRPWAEASALRQLAWVLLALIVLHSLLEYPMWYGPFQLALGACLGWLLAPTADVTLVRSRWAAPAAIAVLVAALGYAAWDYLRVMQIYTAPAARLAPWREDTLAHVRRSWLFQGQARFADVTLAAPTPSNAAWLYPQATAALHYSPEPRVIERVVESAVALGLDDEALLHLARYRAAFPKQYAQWQQRQRMPALPRP
jgi:O-antigen ligase